MPHNHGKHPHVYHRSQGNEHPPFGPHRNTTRIAQAEDVEFARDSADHEDLEALQRSKAANRRQSSTQQDGGKDVR